MSLARVEPGLLLTILTILLLYLPVVAFVGLRMFPQLSPVARRVLQGLIAFQALVTVLKVFYTPDNDFIRWILVSGWELNVPGAVGATQMLTASLVAFLAARLSPRDLVFKRVYLSFIGISFGGMMLDEHFEFFRSRAPDSVALLLGYSIVGLPLAIAIIASALRSERRGRVWGR